MYIKAPKKKSALDCSFYAIVLSCVCALVQLYALPRDMNAWVSLSNRVLMILWVIFVGFAVLKKVEQHYPAKLAGGLVLVVFSVASYFISSVDTPSLAGSMGLKLLGFLILPLMLLYSAVFQIDARAKTAVLIFNLLASGVFIQLYHSGRRHAFVGSYGEVLLDVVTLGYPNANQTAMYLFLCVIGLAVGVFFFKSVLVKALFAADALYITWILRQTGARTSLVLVVLFVVLVWVTGKREVSGAWINMALWIPAVYILMMPLASNIDVLGEPLFNGRDQIFDRYFQNLNVASFLFGSLNLFRLGNLHNGYIAISASVGVPACAGYIHLMKTCLDVNRPRQGAPVFERVAFVGFLCAVMYTSAEAAFFVGGSTYAMLVFSLCVLFAKARFVQMDEVLPVEPPTEAS